MDFDAKKLTSIFRFVATAQHSNKSSDSEKVIHALNKITEALGKIVNTKILLDNPEAKELLYEGSHKIIEAIEMLESPDSEDADDKQTPCPPGVPLCQ